MDSKGNGLFELREVVLMRIRYEHIADLSGQLLEGGLYHVQLEDKLIAIIVHEMFDSDFLAYPAGAAKITAADVAEANGEA